LVKVSDEIVQLIIKQGNVVLVGSGEWLHRKPGETIQVTYNMPAIVQSEYLKRVQAKASLVQPELDFLFQF
jgi:hypothetical protein